jgi:putative PIN family toxin of toxin-antitoxin system
VTRAVVDPNLVIAAAIRPDGAPADCMRAHAAGRFDLVVSPLLLAELGTVLAREKFRPFLTTEQAARLVNALTRDSHIADDPAERKPVSRDPNDDYLIGLARTVSADVLVTGDADLVALDLPDLAIVSPREFIEILP